jgi:hypothetical protein
VLQPEHSAWREGCVNQTVPLFDGFLVDGSIKGSMPDVLIAYLMVMSRYLLMVAFHTNFLLIKKQLI